MMIRYLGILALGASYVLLCHYMYPPELYEVKSQPIISQPAQTKNEPTSPSYEDFLNALATVESDNNPSAVGDRGDALGIYQIHLAYWKDACEFTGLGKDRTYYDVVDPVYAKEIVTAYFLRYARHAYESKNWETLARIHNGGPSIMKRRNSRAWQNTTIYWNKVKRLMGV